MIDITDDRQLVHIGFSCRVEGNNVDRLKRAVEKELSKGIKRFILSMDTKGGEWNPAFEAYKYLKKIGAEVTTHNHCHVDSAAIAIFCAGEQRTCTSKSVFIFHPATSKGAPIHPPQKLLDAYDRYIARVIAESCGQDRDDTLSVIKEKCKFNSEEALSFGLVHKIRDIFDTKIIRDVQIEDGI